MRLKTVLNSGIVPRILRLAVPVVLLAWGALGVRAAGEEDRNFSVTNDTPYQIKVSVDFKNKKCGNEENVTINPDESHGFVRGSKCKIKVVVAWITETGKAKKDDVVEKNVWKWDVGEKQNIFVVSFDEDSKKLSINADTM